MPEGEKRVILSSDWEAKPSREQRQRAESQEMQAEKLKTREYLDRAVLELRHLLADLPKNSKEAKRAEHTLAAVNWALENLGKKGAAEGKYRLEMKDAEGQPAKWPDGKPAVQDEGVPVDELIGLLRGKAEELNREAKNKSGVQKRKKEMEELWERYRLAKDVDLKGQTHDKAWVYSQWEKAKKAYEQAQEAYDLGYTQKGKELGDLADELYKRSETHFCAHFGHELPLSQEESDKQNVRTTHEAYLIHGDYRKTGDKGKDYRAAMDAMGQRRELKMEEELPEPPMAGPAEAAPKPIAPEIRPANIEPELIKPELKPVIPDLELKPEQPVVPEIRAAIVDAGAQVEFLAREKAAKALNEKLNHKNFLKRWWYRAWEEGYRQQLIDEERKKILGEGNQPGWLKQKLFGAKKFAATKEKNLFAGTTESGQNKAELTALAKRFAAGYVRESEGEQRQQLEDAEFSGKINDLVFKYVEGGVSDEEFEKQKDELVSALAKKYPDSFAAGKLTADNFLEAAKEYKKIHEHSRRLARVDIKLGLDLGKAKQAIKTQANIKWVDKLAARLQKYPVLGHVFTPGAVGFGASIGGYLLKRPLSFLGGAVGAGGLLGAMRRNYEQKRDLEMHRIERAMGSQIDDYGPGAKHRQEVEKFVHEMKKASEVAAQLESLRKAFEANSTPEAAAALTRLLAETEARMSLSEERQRDLLSFDGETSLERGRLFLMKELAESKTRLAGKGFDSNIPATQDYRDFMKSLGGNMDKLEKSERYKRWKENAKAAAVGAATGLIVGGLSQQAAAEIGDRVSDMSWLRPGGRATGMEKLYHFIKGDFPSVPSGAGLVETFGIAGAKGSLKIDASTELVLNRSTGLYDVVDKQTREFLGSLGIDPATGAAKLDAAGNAGLLELHSRVSAGNSRSVSEWMDGIKASLPKGASLQEMHTVGFYHNDTVSPNFDFNELRFYMHADAQGNITMDASRIQEYLEDNLGQQVSGSKHGERALDILQAYKNGEIKIAIAPDPDHPSQMLVLEPDPVTHKFVLPAGSDAAKAFGVDASGNVVYKGQGFLGMIENPKGSQEATWINSIRGNGDEIQTGPGTRVVNEITRRQPREWWMPFIPIIPRKALEKYREKQKKSEEKKSGPDSPEKEKASEAGGKDKESLVDKEGKKLGGIVIFEEGDKEEDLRKKLEGKKLKARTATDTRGQKLGTDRKDFGKDYPLKFPMKNEREMAEYLAEEFKDRGWIVAKGRDAEALKGMSQEERVKYLEEAIKKSRQGLEMKEGQIMPPDAAAGTVKFVMDEVEKEFAKYGQQGRSEMPDPAKIHLVGIYEFQAQTRGSAALGLCYFREGEVFVNYELLNQITENNNEMLRELKRTIAHELVHDAAASNYWAYESDDGGTEETYMQRRSGLLTMRRQARGLIKERGRALNEAVTETMAKDITNRIYKQEGAEPLAYKNEPYQAERNVLVMMQEKFKIPFSVFAEAVVNRKALKSLAEKLDGKSKEGNKLERPQFMSLLTAVMDYEHNRSDFDYAKTKQLIEGKQGLQVSGEMKLSFPASLLDKAGNIKASLVELYGLVDMEAEGKKLPKAA